jgi:superfamily I DNA/RNA helicase
VGVYGCLDAVGLDQSVKTEILKRMRGSANSFLEDQLGDLNFATPTDVELIRDFAKACKYWRNQLRSDAGGSVDEVVLDAGQWLASKQPSRYGRETINRAASILAKLKGTLSSRLNFISRSKRGGGKDAAVTLMTMHASKGMEFDTVHVIDANKPDDGSDLANEEGERRLAYVAWTRARNRCLVWYSGEPHPTIREGGLKVLHQFNQLTAMVTSGID